MTIPQRITIAFSITNGKAPEDERRTAFTISKMSETVSTIPRKAKDNINDTI
jgi:hypothetical protein